MSDILVDIQHLTFKRGDRVIYDDMSMQFQRGKVTAIMGPQWYRQNHIAASDRWSAET